MAHCHRFRHLILFEEKILYYIELFSFDDLLAE